MTSSSAFNVARPTGRHSIRTDLPWAAAACLAVVWPAVLAFNVPPSATLFNQVAALVGWGLFLLLVSAALPLRVWPRSAGSTALLGALGLLVASALAAPLWAALPWALSLSSAGVLLAAALAATLAASAVRAGLGERAFVAFCIALVAAGVASSAIGLVQVFLPELPDGSWIAPSSQVGRATGNLRQPNHLSTLLLWSAIGAVWLGEARVLQRSASALLVLLFVFVVFLSGSRTGALGTFVLAFWGLLDRRLSRSAHGVLLLAPLAYAAMWGAERLWASAGGTGFGAASRAIAADNLTSSRLDIWSNALSLIASHPWLGVGFGEFNFAWTLTPFPTRPLEFFDHTHNLLLNFAVELGLPLAALVVGLMLWAFTIALRHALEDGRSVPPNDAAATAGWSAAASAGSANSTGPGTLIELGRGAVDGGSPAPATPGVPMQRAAFMMVLMVAVHSQLEYPLWYAYFLLPAAFAFGLCLERPSPGAIAEAASQEPYTTRPFVVASMLLVLAGTLTVYDYMRVAVIFAPPVGAAPLAERIAEGRRSVLFAHHADYAAATVTESPADAISAFERAPHYLLDARLLTAWASALNDSGDSERASYVAERLKEFHNPAAEAFFAVCAGAPRPPAVKPLPFQCRPPTRTFRFEDFR